MYSVPIGSGRLYDYTRPYRSRFIYQPSAESEKVTDGVT